MVKNIIFLTLIFIISGCGMMGSSSSKDTSLSSGGSNNVATTDLNSTNTDSNLIANNSSEDIPTNTPTNQEESILPQTISIDFPDILKQDISRDKNKTNELNETIEDNKTIENNSTNSTIAEIGYEQLKKNISHIEDVVKIAQINLILLEKVMPQVLDKCDGMISCTFEPKYLSIVLDNETIDKIDDIIDDSNFTLLDKSSRVSLGEIAFTKKSVDEGYDYELKLDMLSDNIRLNNLYKDANRSDINLNIDNELDINSTEINITNSSQLDINVTNSNLIEINSTIDINTTEINSTNRLDLNITDNNLSENNSTTDINISSENNNTNNINPIENNTTKEVNIVDNNNISDINVTDKNRTIKEYQIFKWSDYNSDVITTYVYDNSESIINISIYYLVDEYGKATMHVYNTNNKDGHKENMNLTLASTEDDNSTLVLQANSIEQSFDGNETNVSSFSSNGEISDDNSLILFSGTVSNDNEENNISNSSEVICSGNSSCNESNNTINEIPEIKTNLEFYELKIKDGNLTDGSYVLLPPYTDINGLTLIDVFGLTLGTFTVSNGKAQGEIHNGSYNDMLDRLTIVEINESEKSKTKFRLISSEDRPNIELIEP